MHSGKAPSSDRMSRPALIRYLQVAGVAAAGAVLGRAVSGNLRGTLVGGGLGAAAGTAWAAITDIELVLPEGAHLVLTLK